MTYTELVSQLNGLCWDARRHGHDDYGLDYAVDRFGVDVHESDEPEDWFHPEAVRLAKYLAAHFDIDTDTSDPF